MIRAEQVGVTARQGELGEALPSAWLLRAIVALLLVANIRNLGTDLGATGAATQLLVARLTQFYVVAFAIACALLEGFAPVPVCASDWYLRFLTRLVEIVAAPQSMDEGALSEPVIMGHFLPYPRR